METLPAVEMKRPLRILLWIAGGLLAVILGLAIHEVVIFATSTEASAREQAKADFLSECARSGVNPNEFTGPQRIKSPGTTYGFVWVNSSNGDQIATMVQYLPAGVESWLVRGGQGGKFELYCEDKAGAACP
jgi:hypothetical protein